MKCPDCSTKITAKHYDPEYEIYECPKCAGVYTADELEEAQNGTSPRKRAELAQQSVPTAKGKKKRKAAQDEAEAEAEAIAKFEAETLKPKVAADKEVKHRDEVETGQILEIVADEIEMIWQENGWLVNRVNAREFFAMNIVRPLRMDSSVHFRDKEVPARYCKEHVA